jgi:hypothetical protein
MTGTTRLKDTAAENTEFEALTLAAALKFSQLLTTKAAVKSIRQ